MILQQNWNHVPLVFLKNKLWLLSNDYFATTCLKNQSEHNLKNKIPIWVGPIVVESPFKCLTEASDLASKFTLFLKWHQNW